MPKVRITIHEVWPIFSFEEHADGMDVTPATMQRWDTIWSDYASLQRFLAELYKKQEREDTP